MEIYLVGDVTAVVEIIKLAEIMEVERNDNGESCNDSIYAASGSTLMLRSCTRPFIFSLYVSCVWSETLPTVTS